MISGQNKVTSYDIEGLVFCSCCFYVIPYGRGEKKGFGRDRFGHV